MLRRHLNSSLLTSVNAVALFAVVLGSLPLTSAAVQTDPRTREFGDWSVVSKLDPITDANASVAGTEDADQEWLLAIQCSEGRHLVGLSVNSNSTAGIGLGLQILGRALQGDSIQGSVTWRVDREPPVTSPEWRVADQTIAACPLASRVKLLKAV